jgi:LCP family protein required for cell wall assembly
MQDPDETHYAGMRGVASMRERWPRVLLSVAAGIVLILSLTGVAIEVASNRLQGNITAVDISGTIGRDHVPTTIVDDAGNYQATNILLMGSDSREGQTSSKYGDPELYTGERSDTAILLHLSADRSFATAVSIPRDTWVMLPECSVDGQTVGGFESKFNTAFEVGGPGCTVKLVEQMTGLTVDNFAVIDFEGFKNVVDALGGVEVCLTEPASDPASKLELPAGISVVNGEQALSFVRARKTLSDGSDISRIKRQQAFLSSMIREASSTGLLLNPVKLYSTLDAATSGLKTDPGLADIDVLRDMALSVRGMSPGNIAFLTMPWVERGDGENVVIDEAGAAPIWESIRSDTPWLKPKKPSSNSTIKASDLTVQPSQVSVRVLNGSGVAGRAAEVAAELQAQGFTVAEVADADRADYATTEIRHNAGAAEAARTVLAALPGAMTVADDTATTITIVVGSAYAGVDSIDVDDSDALDSSSSREEDEITSATTADKVRCS